MIIVHYSIQNEWLFPLKNGWPTKINHLTPPKIDEYPDKLVKANKYNDRSEYYKVAVLIVCFNFQAPFS